MAQDWKDITSYSQSGPRTPRWWELRIGNVRLAVGNSHVYFPDGKTWLMNCNPWFDTHKLQAGDEQSAKNEAIALVRQRFNELATAFAELEKSRG